MSITDWEIWACADKMIHLHGCDATIRAAMNADLLLRKGDLDGYGAWMSILHRIKELEQSSPQGSVH